MYNIIYFGPKILKITGNSLILSTSQPASYDPTAQLF